jgi:hypothetical protein
MVYTPVGPQTGIATPPAPILTLLDEDKSVLPPPAQAE